MKVKGVLENIGEEIKVTDKFKRRGFVVMYWNTPEKTEYLSFEFVQDRCSLLDNFETGTYVIVGFNLKGRKYISSDGSEKYFNTLSAWSIEKDPNPPGFIPKNNEKNNG